MAPVADALQPMCSKFNAFIRFPSRRRLKSFTISPSSATSEAPGSSGALRWSRTERRGSRSTATRASSCCAASCPRRSSTTDCTPPPHLAEIQPFSVLIDVVCRYCRADDRGDPVIQLAPPLICTQEHFNEIEVTLLASRLPPPRDVVCAGYPPSRAPRGVALVPGHLPRQAQVLQDHQGQEQAVRPCAPTASSVSLAGQECPPLTTLYFIFSSTL